LRSEVARQYVQQHLSEAFEEVEQRSPAKIRSAVLVQVDKQGFKKLLPKTLSTASLCLEDMGSGANGSSYRGCVSKTYQGKLCQKWTSQVPHEHGGITSAVGEGNNYGLGDHDYCRNPGGEKETIWCYTVDPNTEWDYCQPMEELPVAPGVPGHDCAETDACRIGPGNCARMKDRFLNILAAVVDKRDQLLQDMASAEQECKQMHEELRSSMTALDSELAHSQAQLAEYTKTIQESSQQEAQMSAMHVEYVKDFAEKMKECRDNIKGFLGELWCLDRLRGELFRLEGHEVQITDCEVSDWTDSECTKSCEGGTQERTRDIVEHAVNGTKCPPLRQQRDCNMQKCPVDCEVSGWSSWTQCSAMCGGGVRQRLRTKKQAPKNGGERCPEASEAESCNGQACISDCELAPWGAWSACSKACNTGHRERRKQDKAEALGEGHCPGPQSKERLAFEMCNEDSCTLLLPSGSHRTVLECRSKLDVVILMDGSGSLTDYGFNQSKAMAQKLLHSFAGGGDHIQVAFLMFGGPRSLDAFERCTAGDTSVPLDEEKDCGMHWVRHLATDASAVAQEVGKLPNPRSTTMASMALGLAKTELTKGRPEAQSVVLAITDAKVLSKRKTATAAEDLKKSSRLIWVPIGKTGNEDLTHIKAWASKPWQDNVIEIPDYDLMTTPKMLNSIISSMCPDVH